MGVSWENYFHVWCSSLWRGRPEIDGGFILDGVLIIGLDLSLSRALRLPRGMVCSYVCSTTSVFSVRGGGGSFASRGRTHVAAGRGSCCSCCTGATNTITFLRSDKNEVLAVLWGRTVQALLEIFGVWCTPVRDS